MEKYICATLDLSKSLSNFSLEMTKCLELTNITEWNGKILKEREGTTPLPQIFALTHNFSLNLYRNNMFKNMAQAQCLCSFGLDTLKQLFRMK